MVHESLPKIVSETLTDTIQLPLLPAPTLNKAQAIGGVEGVHYLCAWWNSLAPAARRGADHFGIYLHDRGNLWRSIDRSDWVSRVTSEFVEAHSSAIWGSVIIEFCKTQRDHGSVLSYDLAGTLLTGIQQEAGVDIFHILAARSLRRLANVSSQAAFHSPSVAA